jgi:hypothetical protein
MEGLLLQRLVELCEKHQVPTGLVSYASCDLSSKQWMFANAPDSPLYFTCSREVGCDLSCLPRFSTTPYMPGASLTEKNK